ncbi:hypothetical protein DFH09DRAFT_1103592 [Mycena vulgaris]|nr:hypothetical protein DFH09DRAFT_1103592 [Mycena vulgaris]
MTSVPSGTLQYMHHAMGVEPSASGLQQKYLRNYNPTVLMFLAKLGAFDGLLGAVVQINGEDHLITTHAEYIPSVPSTQAHDVFLREDMRYGHDDVTLCAQYYSVRYCHLGAIRTREHGPPRDDIMWWNPERSDFLEMEGTLTVTRGLGKLRLERFSALSAAVKNLLAEYKAYVEGTPSDQVPSPLGPLVMSTHLALDRLGILPSTYDQMADAMIEYMFVYKPRMEDPRNLYPLRPGKFVGVYTTDPQIAQRFHLAGLPYWYIRPACSFSKENILEIVPVQPPSQLALAAHPNYQPIFRTTNTADVNMKLDAIRRRSVSAEWYKDQFNFIQEPVSKSTQSSSNSHSRDDRNSRSRGSGFSRPRNDQRDLYSPYKSPSKKIHPPPSKTSAGRNKFEPLHEPEMPPTIPAWERALRVVDTSQYPLYPRKTDMHYIFPEPALLASPEFPPLRQQRLHHFLMLRDALLYRLGNPEEGQETLALSSQEWREILSGKVVGQGGQHSKARLRTSEVERVLRPALYACGLDRYHDFPVHFTDVPNLPLHRAWEIIWEIAETNFRFELLALDYRASGLYRPDQCKECFPGRMLMGMPVKFGKQGFAALDLAHRHPYNLCLARLMRNWKGRVSHQIYEASAGPTTWTPLKMMMLEDAVTTTYTQYFYTMFGRAPVIPMRLEHDLGM